MLRFQAGISMPGSQFLKVNLAGESKVKDKKQYSNATLRSLISASTWGCLFTFKRPYLFCISMSFKCLLKPVNTVYTVTKKGLSPSIPWMPVCLPGSPLPAGGRSSNSKGPPDPETEEPRVSPKWTTKLQFQNPSHQDTYATGYWDKLKTCVNPVQLILQGIISGTYFKVL